MVCPFTISILFYTIGLDLQAVDDITVLGELVAYYNVVVLDRTIVSASVYCVILQ